MADYASATVNIYNVSAISDTKILPSTAMSGYPKLNNISIKASPDETTCASFVLRSSTPINNLYVTVSDLTGSGGTIPSSVIDIKTVKCWYQGGSLNDGDPTITGRYLTPELLLHDDSLVNSTGDTAAKWNVSYLNGKNYLKLTNGLYVSNYQGPIIQGSKSQSSKNQSSEKYHKYKHSVIDAVTAAMRKVQYLHNKNDVKLISKSSYIDTSQSTSQLTSQSSYIDISQDSENLDYKFGYPQISEFPVEDSATLEPVNISKNYNKQFWVTLHVPSNSPSGNYSGTIILKSGTSTLKTIKIKLQVLPIVLPNPNIESSIFYCGMITDSGSICSDEKTVAQFTNETKDMLDHGVTNPALDSYWGLSYDQLTQELSIRKQLGVNNTNLYCGGLFFNNRATLPDIQYISSPYGVQDIFIYGPDESSLNDTTNRAIITSIHNAGGKVMDAQSSSQADSVADVLDLAVVSLDPSLNLSNKYHTYGHKIYSYANPQAISEYPRTFRLNYGLLLWQRNYDGAMDFAYQQSYGNIWNDFDGVWRDHVMAYPTMTGVINTIQWEGFREGTNDLRYLAALQSAIAANPSNSSSAVTYLNNLKNANLSNADLDAIRSQMADYTISLSNK